MAAIVDGGGCSVSAGPGGTWVVTKTAGVDGVGDSGAVSAAPVAADFVLRVRPLATGTAYFGVSADPSVGISPESIDRAVRVSGTSCRSYDNGSPRPGLFLLDTYVWMRRTAGTLDYLTGPELATAQLKRSVAGIEGPLGFDSALLTLGLSLEVAFEAGAPGGAKARPPLALAFGF